MRSLITNLVRIAVVLLVARAFFVEPIAVQTSSMATQLLGAHAAAMCPQCGQEIVWGTDVTPLDVNAVACPRCGAEQTEFAERVPLGGDRLLVNRNAYLFRLPRRWEIVAFRDPEIANRTLVKRIAGLPGELISLRDGDLFRGKDRIQKSLADLRAVAIPVGESSDRIEESRFSPWRGETQASHWETHPERGGLSILHLPTLSAADYDWLLYRPRPAERGALASGVTDELPYNQDRLRRNVPVSDVMLSFRARFQGDGRLAIRFPTRADVLLTLEPKSGRLEVLAGGESQSFVELGPVGNAPIEITAAYCDGRVLAEIGGEPVEFDLADGATAAESPAALGIGVAGLGVEISHLRLERDIYYLPPDRGGGAYQLSEDEYLMLGDNPARSLDSRYWKTPGVRRNSLLGRPFLVHGASRAAETAGWSFQVPDFERIRYIPPASGE